MAEQASTGNLFAEGEENTVDEIKKPGASAADKTSGVSPKQHIDDIEKWLQENLKSIIPPDMQSMYINKNNILFAFKSESSEQQIAAQCKEWISQLTKGGRRSVLSSFDVSAPFNKIANHRLEEARKRVALDYKTDPSFIRVIDVKTGKYILSNLLKAAAEQRAGLLNYVEYVRRNIDLLPLPEELNRYALTQKLAYEGARKHLWFLLGLAEELKLVQKSKSFTFKVAPVKNGNDHNPFLLDKHVTAKWLNIRPKVLIGSPAPGADRTAEESKMLNSMYQEDFASGSIMREDSSSFAVPGDSSQALSSFKMMDMMQDSALSNTQLMSTFGINESVGPFGDFNADVSMSNLFNFDESLLGSRRMDSFKGSISGSSWKALEQSKIKKTKVANTQKVDTVQKFLEKIGNKRTSNELKNAINTVTVLEAACKLFGTGPKWSNPDKNEFDAGNKRNALVYVMPPRGINQNSIAYNYLLQYKSIHQKLNGGVRQQHAVSYGLITLGQSAPGEPVSSFQVNSAPWSSEKYGDKWKKLASCVGKSPWMNTAYQPIQNTDTTNADEPVKQGCVEEVKGGENPIISEQHEAPLFSEHQDPSEPGILPEENNGREHETQTNEKDNPATVIVDVSHSPVQESEETVATAVCDENDKMMVEGTSVEMATEEQHPSVENTTKAPVDDSRDKVHAGGDFETEVETGELKQQPVASTEKDTEDNRITSQKAEARNVEPLRPHDMSFPGRQMKLTELFRYVYTKMKKVKPLPEVSPELIGRAKHRLNRMEEDQTRDLNITGKRKRILDEDLLPDAITLNYAQINKSVTADESPNNAEEAPGETPNVQRDSNVVTDVHKTHKKERIRKMREFVKNMFEVEAEESEDENLSDPEDIRKKLQLLKERLQHSSGESESDYESDSDVAEEMKDFIAEVETFNAEDEELAKQRFYADIKQQEENELSKLMPLKERSERELTRREERMKLLMQLKKAKHLHDIQDLHPSDFESSDEEDGEKSAHGKPKRRISKAELEQLLRFKTGGSDISAKISETDELRVFIESKLQGSNKHTDEAPTVRNQIERVTNSRRDTIDNLLSSRASANIFGENEEKSAAKTSPFGVPSTINRNLAADPLGCSSKQQSTIVMKSFRLNQSMMKPLNSTNIRNVGGFTGFHKPELPPNGVQSQNLAQKGSKANTFNKF
ncbi:mature-parasite-infected erythrocyte surface antigen, putative [Babesia ovata]|uniref:Mature-parasite-infected erythrocyte surface antigen, putative n=1 Tax=Babesia ovata TaxID=189622 RepID=A0A2H6KDW7_9APIC|nr:mature-parasite-infected erythrocyte surface antigen, putative [Babesia ovata]GBE61185.1 mature-parasite-infected erythrocyte surface antigen, putative [Babesia ovata]